MTMLEDDHLWRHLLPVAAGADAGLPARASPPDDERALRARAAVMIRAGRLPNRQPDSVWGGAGLAIPCALCGAPIDFHEVEWEPEFVASSAIRWDELHLHPRCFEAWEHESKRGPGLPDGPVDDSIRRHGSGRSDRRGVA